MSQIGGAGGASGQIGHLFVQFSQQGAQALQQGVAAVGQQMAQVGQQTAAVGQQMGQQFTAMQGSTQALGQSISQRIGGALTALSAQLAQTGRGLGQAFMGTSQMAQGLAGAISGVVMPLQGMVMAGIAASSMGQVMSLQFQELNRQLASLFIPVINWVSQKLAALIQWFRSLTGEQQKSLREWGLMLAGITMASMILPRVIASFQALQTVLIGVRTAMVGISLANPFMLLAAGAGLALASTASMEDVMQGVSAAMKELMTFIKSLGGVLHAVGSGIKSVADVIPGRDAKKEGWMSWAMKVGSPMNPIYLSRGMLMPGLQHLGMSEGGAKNLSTYLGAALYPFLVVAGAVQRHRGKIGPKDDEGGGPPEDRQELAPRLGGMEDVKATWTRFAMASRVIGINQEKTEQQQMAETLKEIKQDTGSIHSAMKESRSWIGK